MNTIKEINKAKSIINNAIDEPNFDVQSSIGILDVYFDAVDNDGNGEWLNLSYDIRENGLKLFRMTINATDVDCDIIADNTLRSEITAILPAGTEEKWFDEQRNSD